MVKCQWCIEDRVPSEPVVYRAKPDETNHYCVYCDPDNTGTISCSGHPLCLRHGAEAENEVCGSILEMWDKET